MATINSVRETVLTNKEAMNRFAIGAFPSYFAKTILSAKESRRYADVELRGSDGTTFRLHRAVLSSCSPFLRSLFADLDGDQLPLITITLPDISQSTLKGAISLMYSGLYVGTNDNCSDVFQSMNALQANVKELQLLETGIDFQFDGHQMEPAGNERPPLSAVGLSLKVECSETAPNHAATATHRSCLPQSVDEFAIVDDDHDDENYSHTGESHLNGLDDHDILQTAISRAALDDISNSDRLSGLSGKQFTKTERTVLCSGQGALAVASNFTYHCLFCGKEMPSNVDLRTAEPKPMICLNCIDRNAQAAGVNSQQTDNLDSRLDELKTEQKHTGERLRRRVGRPPRALAQSGSIRTRNSGGVNDFVTVTRRFRCDLCREEFPVHSALVKHKRKAHNSATLLACVLCETKLTTKYELKRHMRQAHNILPKICCRYCDSVYTDQTNLRIHMHEKHADLLTFSCEQCEKKFFNENDLRDHTRAHAFGRQHECEVCKKRFRTKSYLTTHHYLVHTSPEHWTTFQCKICTKVFNTKQNFDLHQVVHSGQKLFSCDHCQRKFTRKDHLKNHCKTMHVSTDGGQVTYKCEKCEKVFKRKGKFNLHQRQHLTAATDSNNSDLIVTIECDPLLPENYDDDNGASGEASADTVDADLRKGPLKPFACKLCGKRFRLVASVEIHIRKLHGVAKAEGAEDDDDATAQSGSFLCEKCSKVFPSQIKLRRHYLYLHKGGKDHKPHKCSICPKSYTLRRNLDIHVRGAHTGEKPFVCTACNKGFTSDSQLHHHEVAVHSGDKSFQCDECGKAYGWASSLRQHKRVHKNEKAFKCPHCSMGFNLKVNLRRHLVTHTGMKPFECESCSKRFSRPEYLKNHMTTHTGERPHLCDHCGMSFREKAAMKKHRNVHFQ